MTEEESAGASPDLTSAPETEKKPRRKRPGLILVLLLLVLLVLAALGYIFRDRLFAAPAVTPPEPTPTLQAEPAFSYESGSNQTFALAGNGLAVASASGIRLMDENGSALVSQICSMDAPAVSASKSLALFYDIGGSLCKAADFSGNVTDMDVGESIISADVNSSGYFAVISEETGCKGLVRVFDSNLQLIYEWYSGSGYALKALVSPDNRQLAVLCAESSGSVIHTFRLSSEDELAAVRYDGELLFDLAYTGNSRLRGVSRNGLYFTDTDGDNPAGYSFDGWYLVDYDLQGDNFSALCLSEYRAGGACSVRTVDNNGEMLGELPVTGDITALSASGRQLLVATSGSIALYSQTMQEQRSAQTLVTAKQLVLRPGGDVLLLSSYSAEPFSF